MAINVKVNGATRSVNAEPDAPLLYVLRNDLELNAAVRGFLHFRVVGTVQGGGLAEAPRRHSRSINAARAQIIGDRCSTPLR